MHSLSLAAVGVKFLSVTLIVAQNQMINNTGFNVRIIDYPYHMFLAGSIGMCGASIIGQKWAITSAHCVQGAVESRMYLRAGSSFYYHGGQTFGVSSYYMHPNYNSFTRDYDVALLQIISSFPASAAVPLAYEIPEPGSVAIVTGWGTSSAFTSALTYHLKGAYMAIESKSICWLSDQFRFTDRMSCARRYETTKCYNDDGSPIVVGFGRDKKQIGISTSDVCNLDGLSYFTSIPVVYNWTKSITG